MSDRNTLLKNVEYKLNGLPLSLGVDIQDGNRENILGGDLNDALRMAGKTVESIPTGSKDELIMEICTVINTLKRFRTSTSVFFKYSTGSDGTSVDKTKVSDAIDTIIQDFKNDISNITPHASGIWGRSRTVVTNSTADINS